MASSASSAFSEASSDKSHLLYTYGSEYVATLDSTKLVLYGHLQSPLSWGLSRSLGQVSSQIITRTGGIKNITPADLEGCSCVIYAEAALTEAVELNDVCRSAGIPFLWASQLGPLVSVFCDPAEDVPRLNPHGYCRSDSLLVRVGNINTDVSPMLVTCTVAHGLSENDVVSIDDGQYEVGLVVSATEFNAVPAAASQLSGSVGKSSPQQKSGNAIKLVWKADKSETKRYCKLSDSLWRPAFDSLDGDLVQQPVNLAAHLAFLCRIQEEKKEEDIADKLDGQHIVDMGYVKGLLDRINEFSGSPELTYGVITGVVTSQVLNLVTRRFPPLCQWFHLDLVSPTGSKEGESQRNLHVVLFGHGPLGCATFLRLLEEKSVSRITLAGDDVLTPGLACNVQKNRDLFREIKMGKPVWEYLRDYTVRTNSAKTVGHAPGLGIDSQSFFNDEFFSGVSAIVCADGDFDERRSLGVFSVQFHVPLIDLGIQGLMGHCQLVIPHMTESYSCSNDRYDDDAPPFCVLKSFPFSASHAIDWAVAKVNTLLRQKPDAFNTFWQQGSPEELSDSIMAGDRPEHVVLAAKLFICGQALCSSWSECVSLARNKFEKYFVHKALQLLTNFPATSVDEQSRRFWTFPKRPPKPVMFDPECPNHLGFVKSLATAWAAITGVEPTSDELSDEYLKSVLHSVTVVPFVPKNKKIVVDESVSKSDALSEVEESADDLNFDAFAQKIKSFRPKVLDPLAVPFHQLDRLIYLATCLRCQMYGISLPDPAEVARLAGKVCPCPQPTVEVLSDLGVLELRRSVEHQEVPRNWWLNLSNPFLVLPAAPRSPATYTLSSLGCNRLLTLWNIVVVKGDPACTLGEFLTRLDQQAGVQASLIVQGSRMIYVKAMPTHVKKKAKLMSSLVVSEPGAAYARLSVEAEGREGADDMSMVIKYYTAKTAEEGFSVTLV